MKIAYCTYPLNSAHKDRGIGVYTKNLLQELKKTNLNIETFDNPNKEPKADLTHYPYFDLFFHTMPVRSKNKKVVTVHDVIPLVFPDKFPVGIRGKINFQLQKMSLKNSKAIICDSKTSGTDTSKYLGIPLSKIKTVYLAQGTSYKKILDAKRLDKIKNKYNLPSDFVLFAGNVNWNKNLETLLEAISLNNRNIVLTGASHQNKELVEVQRIDKLITELKIEKQIFRVGPVTDEELAVIYNLASCTAIPSYYEGFGLPVLESMACGTPVVCSNNSSLVEIASDLAFLCDPNLPSDISEQIEKAHSSKTLKFSKELILHASKYSWQKVAAETVDIYKSIFQ